MQLDLQIQVPNISLSSLEKFGVVIDRCREGNLGGAVQLTSDCRLRMLITQFPSRPPLAMTLARTAWMSLACDGIEGPCHSVPGGGSDRIRAMPGTEFSLQLSFGAPLVAAKFLLCAMCTTNAPLLDSFAMFSCRSM